MNLSEQLVSLPKRSCFAIISEMFGVYLNFLAIVTLSSAFPDNNRSWNPLLIPNGCVAQLQFSSYFNAYLRTLDCRNSSIVNFPSNSLIPSDTQVMNLSGNKIRRIFNSHLVLPDMQQLDLSNNEIGSIGFDSVFEGFFNCRILDLSGNRISQLKNNLFQGLFNLEDLNLSKNRIGSISEDSFRGLQHLLTLNLASNKLSYVQSSWWFGVRTTLSKLDLSDNSISLIQADNFKPLHHLSTLDLSSNKIFRVNDKGLFGLNQLESLNLASNRFSSVPGEALKLAKTLKSLKLDRNPICKLLAEDLSSLPNLQDLSLKYLPNLKLTEAKAIADLPNLRVVQLNNNPSLVFLDSETFYKCPTLTSLLLHNNNISTIDFQVISNLNSLAELSLFGNPLNCDCNSHWIWERISSGKKPRLIDADRLICDSPTNWKFRLLTSLNEISSTCQPQIIAETFPAEIRRKQGDSLLLECRAAGVPKPNVSWTDYNGIRLTNDGNLIIVNLKLETSGVFICQAENSEGFHQLETNVTVEPLDVELHITRIGQTAVTMVWNGTDRGKFAYQLVLRPVLSSDNYRYVGTVTPSMKSFTMAQLRPNTPYRVCLELEADSDSTVIRLSCANFVTKNGLSVNGNRTGSAAVGAVSAIIAIMTVAICLAAVGLKRCSSSKKSRYDQIEPNHSDLFASPKSDATNLYCPLIVARGQNGYEAAYVAISQQSTRRNSESALVE